MLAKNEVMQIAKETSLADANRFLCSTILVERERVGGAIRPEMKLQFCIDTSVGPFRGCVREYLLRRLVCDAYHQSTVFEVHVKDEIRRELVTAN